MSYRLICTAILILLLSACGDESTPSAPDPAIIETAIILTMQARELLITPTLPNTSTSTPSVTPIPEPTNTTTNTSVPIPTNTATKTPLPIPTGTSANTPTRVPTKTATAAPTPYGGLIKDDPQTVFAYLLEHDAFSSDYPTLIDETEVRDTAYYIDTYDDKEFAKAAYEGTGLLDGATWSSYRPNESCDTRLSPIDNIAVGLTRHVDDVGANLMKELRFGVWYHEAKLNEWGSVFQSYIQTFQGEGFRCKDYNARTAALRFAIANYYVYVSCESYDEDSDIVRSCVEDIGTTVSSIMQELQEDVRIGGKIPVWKTPAYDYIAARSIYDKKYAFTPTPTPTQTLIPSPTETKVPTPTLTPDVEGTRAASLPADFSKAPLLRKFVSASEPVSVPLGVYEPGNYCLLIDGTYIAGEAWQVHDAFFEQTLDGQWISDSLLYIALSNYSNEITLNASQYSPLQINPAHIYAIPIIMDREYKLNVNVDNGFLSFIDNSGGLNFNLFLGMCH